MDREFRMGDVVRVREDVWVSEDSYERTPISIVVDDIDAHEEVKLYSGNHSIPFQWWSVEDLEIISEVECG
jgi:hypothetical protein